MHSITEPGLTLLLRRLKGVRRVGRSYPFWKALCPCPDHNDTEPSLLIEYKEKTKGFYANEGPKVYVYCPPCGAKLLDVCEAVGLEPKRVLARNGYYASQIGKPYRPPEALPSLATVAEWCSQLEADPERLAYLHEVRGLKPETIRAHHIGHDGARYTLPVYQGLELVNVRKYLPGAATGKMRGLAGRTSKNLYPDLPDRSWLLLCEGEWDALLARQHGFPAFTSTGGIYGWDTAWNPAFTGRHVYIAYDCQDVSRKAAVARAGQLRGIAAAVKIIELELNDKEDVSDWFNVHGRTAAELRALIKGTAVWHA